MAEHSWQLAAEVVAPVAAAQARERRRTATILSVGSVLVALLLALLLVAFVGERSSADAAGAAVAPAMFLFLALLVTSVWLAARARKEARRLEQVGAATRDPTIAWFLTPQEIVASVHGTGRRDLAIAISLRTRTQLTAMPRATVVHG